MLQPMHSRMSSGRPSSIFLGRKGSAMEGRAAPMMSHWPALMTPTMSSGTGEAPVVDDRYVAHHGLDLVDERAGSSWSCGSASRLRPRRPIPRDRRSWWTARPTTPSRARISQKPSPSSKCWMPRSPRVVSRLKRAQMALSSPHALLSALRTSMVKRARFSSEPP